MKSLKKDIDFDFSMFLSLEKAKRKFRLELRKKNQSLLLCLSTIFFSLFFVSKYTQRKRDTNIKYEQYPF
jgi:hypothetical protein